MKLCLVGVFAVGTVLSLATSAEAQERSEILVGRHHNYESPQNFALEFRGGPYRPNIDSEAGLKGGPYESNYEKRKPWLLAVELDWQALRRPFVGTLGPGVGAGYWTISGRARFTQPHPGDPISAEESSLDIYPFYGVAVLRVDVLAREAHIPIVPYAKAGIGVALWRAYNTGGTSDQPDYSPSTGKGHTFGTHLAAGVALHLDFLDPGAAASLDNSLGINNTYLFIEYMQSSLTGISQKHPLYVGSDTWSTGLAFEF